jgi:adenylate cyclase
VSRSSSPFADQSLAKELLDALGLGVAVADAQSWEVMFENARFAAWFDSEKLAGSGLDHRVPGLDRDDARRRLAAGNDFRFEAEAGSGARAVPVEVTLRLLSLGDQDVVVAECEDVGRLREAEYMLDSHTRMVERHARDLGREKERAEMLLLNTMPRAVYEEMKDLGSVAPRRFDEATVLLLDFAGFTEMAVSRDPDALVSELNDIFSAFDRIVGLFHCERMKTIGDAYMAAAGIPEPSSDHALNIARVALRMRRYLETRNASHDEQWQGRIGVHTGPVVGSMIGVHRWVYDIFGPGVNLAARMESLAEPMQIAITEQTHELIREEFVCSERGVESVKGFGEQRVFVLEDELNPR